MEEEKIAKCMRGGAAKDITVRLPEHQMKKKRGRSTTLDSQPLYL